MATIREADLVDFEDVENGIRVQQCVDPQVDVFHVGQGFFFDEETFEPRIRNVFERAINV